MKITDIIVESSCKHGQYYCSTDKKWKCRQGPKQSRATEAANPAQQAAIAISKKKEKLKEFAPDGFNGNDGEEFNPNLAKMAYDEGVVKGASLADGATTQRAMAINDWDKHDGGIYSQHFAKGFKKGRLDKIRHNNKQYNLNLQLMKDGSIRHGEQGVAEEKQRLDPKCWDGYKKDGTKMKGGVRVNNCVKEDLEETYEGNEFFEAYGELWFNEDEQLDEAEYQGRKVQLGKPMRGDVKKFKVYVKDPSTGNIKKVNFGDPDMKIRKSNPKARKSFRARHNCDNPGPRTKARYWSCRKW